MDADVAVGESVGSLSTKTGIAIHHIHGMTSNAVIASTEKSQPIGRLLDAIVDSYYNDSAPPPKHENVGRQTLQGRRAL